ncbi:MAG: PGF-pre-PGF domain-containing protein [Nanoarchaeota archaeon]
MNFLGRALLVVIVLFAIAVPAYSVECWTFTEEATCTAEVNEPPCNWREDQWGSFCETKGCWNYQNPDTCPADLSGTDKHCAWQTSAQESGWCEMSSCWSYSGTNESNCEENEAGLTCTWFDQCSGPEQCWQIQNASACYNTTGCLWGNCQSQGCWAYTTEGTCEGQVGEQGNACAWNLQYNYCYETGCSGYSTSEDCLAASCKWQNNYCSEYFCSDFSFVNDSACVNNTYNLTCAWSAPWCNDNGCWNFNTQEACSAQGCTWKISQQQGWCNEVQCWSWDGINGGNQTACEENAYGLDCVWASDGGDSGWCYMDVTGVNCSSQITERSCMDTYYCWWMYTDPQDPSQGGECNEPQGGGGFFQEWNPGCYIFDSAPGACNNITVCSHDGTNCNGEGVSEDGINCSVINETTLCNSIPALSTCCIWQGGTCEENRFGGDACHANMEAPPQGANFCEDFNAYTSQTLCEQIAGSPWFMPCEWNDDADHCQFQMTNVFGSGEGNIMMIDNPQNCEFAGGQWLIDTYCELQGENYVSVPAGRCEFKFEDERNCDKACFACEYQNDGSEWTSATEADDACRGSRLGYCDFEASTNSRNGFGFCKPKEEHRTGVAKDCKTDCGACSFMGDPESSQKYSGSQAMYTTCLAPSCYCQNSPVNCQWIPDPVNPTDESIGHCGDINEKTCTDRCDKCYDDQACSQAGQGGNGACTWDASMLICKPTSSTGMETCWDGVDNDDNGNTDCSDSKCFSDTYCGGGSSNEYMLCAGYNDLATCNASNCSWVNETWGSWCDHPSARCWSFDGNEDGCLENDQYCDWHSGFGGFCEINESQGQACWMQPNVTACNETADCLWMTDPWCVEVGGWCTGGEQCYGMSQAGCSSPCTWEPDPWCAEGGGFCDYGPFTCWQYPTSEECGTDPVNCVWFPDPYAPGGGWCSPNSACPTYQSSEECAENSCVWVSGFCDPDGFGGEGGGGGGGMNCFQYNGNQTLCENQTGCSYQSNGVPFCSVSMAANCQDLSYSQGNCTANPLCMWRADMGPGFCDFRAMECMWNQTLQMDQDKCNANPFCMYAIDLEMCEPECANGDYTAETCPTVNVNGNNFCAWMDGWCNPEGQTEMFQGMEGGAPLPLGGDMPGDADQSYVDIVGFGMKDMGDAYGFGTPVSSFTDAAICNGQRLQNGQTGQGTNTAKFYWYLDTNGEDTGDCSLKHDAEADGYEYYFRYAGEWSGGSLTETYNSYKCVNGEWGPADIMLSTWKKAMCEDIGGGMVAIKKSDLGRFPELYDPTADMRVFVATANGSLNASEPSDVAGPGWTTPGSVDFELQNMFAMGGGNAAYEDILQRGYTQYEDCLNGDDDDDDGLVDCDDYDCQFASRCEGIGVNLPGFEDTSSPTITGLKVEEYSDSALVMYDSNKPTNGTLEFYHNDSSCSTLNDTIYDIGILSESVRNWKVWHTANIFNDNGVRSLTYDLQPSTSYYYKLKVCDYGGKCALSKCTSFTTPNADNCGFCNYVVRIKTPDDWVVSYDLDYDGTPDHVQGQVCGQQAGMKANSSQGRRIDLKLTKSDNTTYLEFINASTSKTALNDKVRSVDGAGDFVEGTTTDAAGNAIAYTGMISATRDKIVNNLHPEVCYVKLPEDVDCTHLWHCEDDLGTCEDMTEEAELINDSECIWQVPYCEFSVWATGQPGTPDDGDDGNNGGGGGGGGGGGLVSESGPQKKLLWEEIAEGRTVSMPINMSALPVKKVTFTATKKLTNPSLTVKALAAKPNNTADAPSAAYQWIEVVRGNINETDISGISMEFEVNGSWMRAHDVNVEDVVLFRLGSGGWQTARASMVGVLSEGYRFVATLPGFSYFAIGFVKPVPEGPATAPGGEPSPELPLDETLEQDLEPETEIGEGDLFGQPGPARKSTWIMVLAIVLLVAGGLSYFMTRRAKKKAQNKAQ